MMTTQLALILGHIQAARSDVNELEVLVNENGRDTREYLPLLAHSLGVHALKIQELAINL